MSHFDRQIVTIYNVYGGISGVRYFPTVFPRCTFVNDYVAQTNRQGIETANTSLLTVKKRFFPKPFLYYEDWVGKLNEELDQYFTVNPKGATEGGRDFIIEGAYVDILDSRGAQALRETSRSFTVNTFGDYLEYGHIEIGGV